MLEMLSFVFIQRALIVGILVSICSAFLGINLVLKRYSMIGDGLSHVAFGALALAAVMNLAPLLVSIPTVIIAAFVLLKLGEKSYLKGDAVIALIASTSMALGVIITSVSNMNINVNSYMFGSILSLSHEDVIICIIMSVIVLVLYVVFYNRLFSITFDESYAKATGIRVGNYNALLSILTAITVTVGMKIMGTLLVSSLLIFPTLTSMRIFQSYKDIIISSLMIAITCFLSGLVISYMYDFPTGATIVMMNFSAFVLFVLISRMFNLNV